MEMTEHPLILQVLGDHVEHCKEAQHQGSGVSACASAVSLLDHERDEATRAEQFRVEEVASRSTGKLPACGWSTVELMDALRSSLCSPPWQEPIKRVTVIHEALQHLTERGVPAEGLIRDGFGGELQTRMVLRLTGTWWAQRHLGAELPGLLRHAEPWFPLISDDARGAGPDQELHEVVLGASSGSAGRAAGRCIDASGMDEVIGWRMGAPRGTPDPRSRRRVDRWLADRFTKSSCLDRRTSSLHWELAWLDDMDETASASGVPRAVLAERPTQLDQVAWALGRRTREAAVPRGVTTTVRPTTMDLVEDVMAAIVCGQHEQAMALSESGRRIHRDDPLYLQASAFCQVPFDPTSARASLEELVFRQGGGDPFAVGCLACSRIAEGDVAGARDLLDGFVSSAPAATGWLWDPGDLLEGSVRPGLVRTSLDRWTAEARRAVDACRSAMPNEAPA